MAAYAAAARLEDADLKALVDSVADMRAGKSDLVFSGNKIQGYHVEQIWPQMITMLDKAAETGRAGKPTEVNAQYYELTSPNFVGKLAENAAAGNDSVRATLAQWMGSPGHCRNMMGADFREVAVARKDNLSSTYRFYWIMVLGTPMR